CWMACRPGFSNTTSTTGGKSIENASTPMCCPRSVKSNSTCLDWLEELMTFRIIRLPLFPLLALLSAVAQNSSPKDATPKTQPAPIASREALIARAKSFELNTPYVPPPGDPLVHHTSGYAKIMCSAVFITALNPDFAAENVGYFTSPYAERAKVS